VGRESDGTTRTHAEEFIEKLRRDAREGRLSLPQGRKVALSFRDAAGHYLERLEQGDGKDIKMKRARFDHHLVPFFGDMPLSKISTFDVERYKKTRRSEIAKRGKPAKKAPSRATPNLTRPATINRELAALSHLFNMAIEWGWITHRPAKIKRIAEGEGRITYLTAEQAASLLEAAGKDDDAHVYLFVRIGLATGMRRMEILSIRREHVELERKTIQIPNAKAGARAQPITADLAAYLRDYMDSLPKDEQWLFHSPRSAVGHRRDIRKPFRRVVAASGLDPDQIVRHTLRHTAITHLVQAGVDLPTVKRISGHKTLIMVERYAHANGEHIRAAMDRLERRYAAGAEEAGALAGSSGA
jgi:integrase